MATKKKRTEGIAAPVLHGVRWLDWNKEDGRARGAIVRDPVSSEVMRQIYRRVVQAAQLDLTESLRRRIFAFICVPGEASKYKSIQ